MSPFPSRPIVEGICRLETANTVLRPKEIFNIGFFKVRRNIFH